MVIVKDVLKGSQWEVRMRKDCAPGFALCCWILHNRADFKKTETRTSGGQTTSTGSSKCKRDDGELDHERK